MAHQGHLPELVRDSKLSTSFQPNLTIHTKPSSRRNGPKQEIWHQEKMLGHGGFGVVWLQRRISESPVGLELRAVKQIQISDRNSGAKGYVRELEALAKFSQDRYKEFFVISYGWYESSGYLYITTEYCEYGDLRAYLKDAGSLPECHQAQDIAAQVLGGLIMMHEVGFAHGDINPENILIKSKPPEDDWWVKICDLGLSKRTEGIASSTTVRGTPGFMPPEIIGFNGDPKTADPYLVDMWCFGETVFQMLTSSPTFSTLADLLYYYNNHLGFPSKCMKEANTSEDALDFVRSLMAANPNERLTATKARDHPWMTSALEHFNISQESIPFNSSPHQESSTSYFTTTDPPVKASAVWTTAEDPIVLATTDISPGPYTNMRQSRSTPLNSASHQDVTAPSTAPKKATSAFRPEVESINAGTRVPKSDSTIKTLKEEPDFSDLNIYAEETSFEPNKATSSFGTEHDSANVDTRIPQGDSTNRFFNTLFNVLWPFRTTSIPEGATLMSYEEYEKEQAAIEYFQDLQKHQNYAQSSGSEEGLEKLREMLQILGPKQLIGNEKALDIAKRAFPNKSKEQYFHQPQPPTSP